MRLIDSHCHLDFPIFDPDRADILRRCRALGIRDIVVPGVEARHWPRQLGLCQSEPGLHPALGLHPLFVEHHREEDLALLQQRIEQARPVAIGEIGLDFYPAAVDRARQLHLFEQQLLIARNANLPVLLHVRKAHEPVLKALKEIGAIGGIAHAFNGSLQQARRYMALGFKLGFGGMLTYERSRKLRRLAQNLPLEAIVLETDAPDMTVAAHRGERNSPEYLPDILAALARLKSESAEEIAAQTTRNALEVLNLES